jgi:hypothetical protein
MAGAGQLISKAVAVPLPLGTDKYRAIRGTEYLYQTNPSVDSITPTENCYQVAEHSTIYRLAQILHRKQSMPRLKSYAKRLHLAQNHGIVRNIDLVAVECS